VALHGAAGLLSVAVHRSPTTGGVLASYGSLCDLRVAEAGATIGFAGPRVVEHTVGQSVEGRSHTAETALAAGLVDAVAEYDDLGEWVHAALGLRQRPLAIRPLPEPEVDPVGTGSWATVLRARRVGRPTGIDVAAAMCSSWTGLGEGVDPTLRAGLATVAGRRVVLLASDRYAGTGRPTPAAYRLAQRALALAGRLGLAVITLVDLPGAEPGPDAENDGVAGEIARTFAAMATLPTVCVSVCVGEGGSGGALALAGGDRFLMQADSVFSVIGPEGAAAILERDPDRAPAMAEQLRLTSADLLDLGVIDEVVGEHPEDVVKAVIAALEVAEPGDRLRRADAATADWLRGIGAGGPGQRPATDPLPGDGEGGDGSSTSWPA
jgi:acetyl-CoA carboxylase carboxyl transferase subunit beta